MLGPSGELADVIALRPRRGPRPIIIAETGNSARAFAARHNLGDDWTIVRNMFNCNGLDGVRIGEIYRADRVPANVREITAELNRRRALQRPDQYRAPAKPYAIREHSSESRPESYTPALDTVLAAQRPAPSAIMSAVLSGVRSTGRRDAIAGTVDEVVAKLDALPAGTVIRGTVSGSVSEAQDDNTDGRVWFSTGSEVEDTSLWIAENEGAPFAILFVPERTQSDRAAA